MDVRQVRNFALAAGCLLLWNAAAKAELANPDSVLFPVPARNAVTFWGHACCYIDVDGFGIVTDPVFDRSAAGRRRRVGIPPPESYRGARLVLVSHAHADHLSPATLATFPREAVVLCPPPAAEFVEKAGIEAIVLKPGDEYAYPGGRVVAVTALHAGGRWGIGASADGGALGWVVETPAGTVYYSGDTNYFDGFADVGRRYRPDVAIISMSGHINAEDAVSAAIDTRARFVIPAHFGSYGWFFFDERRRPRHYEELARRLGPLLVTLSPGQSMPLPGVPR